jgi:hypothetical protein
LSNNEKGFSAPPDINTLNFGIQILQAGTVTSQQVLVITCTDASSILEGQHLTVYTPTDHYYLWAKKDGVGTDPALPGKIGIVFDVFTGDTVEQVTKKVLFAFQGKKLTLFKINPPPTVPAGSYFFAYTTEEKFVVYMEKDENGDDPNIPDHKSIKVSFSSSDSENVLSNKINKALSGYYMVIPQQQAFARYKDNYSLVNIKTRTDRGDGTVGDEVGTLQHNQVIAHGHEGLIQKGVTGTSISAGGGGVGFAKTISDYYGGNETYPSNMLYNKFLKY